MGISNLQNTTYNEALYSAWGTQGPSRTAMPSISRLQKMAEAAWAQGFDVQVNICVYYLTKCFFLYFGSANH